VCIRAAFRSGFDEGYMVAEPGEKRFKPLFTPRPPIPASSDNHKRSRRQQVMQRLFSIAA
jgi:hypothetical protein